MAQFQDIEKLCKDCGKPFVDRAKDQAFRADHGWVDGRGELTPMTRCYDCRQKRKKQKQEGGDIHDRGKKPTGYR